MPVPNLLAPHETQCPLKLALPEYPQSLFLPDSPYPVPTTAYSGEVNGMFQRDVNSRSGDENKVGAKLRWDCNHA